MPTTGEVPALGILTSRIGRRFVAMFLGCALLPLIVFAWMTLARVTEQQIADTENVLHSGAKTAGMGVAARLGQVAADLTRLADAWTPDQDSVDDHAAERCADLWLLDAGGPRALRGTPLRDVGPPIGAELVHLATGRPLLRVAGTPPRLVMIVPLRTAEPARQWLVGALHGDRFWDPQELRCPGAEFAVLDRDARPLFHSFRTTPQVHSVDAVARPTAASGTFEWRVDGEPHVARFWRAFLSPQYRLDLLVVQSKARAHAYAIADAFTQWFVLTAVGTLLCVLLASLVQIRRTLGPVLSLRAATRRVAQGDLGVRVSIASRDELGALGNAFNHMTAQLQENVRKREQTERELLASRDQALAAARAKAEFVTNVSHEFRTPMTEILGAIEILGQVGDTDAAARREFTAIAGIGARRLARLIDDVLELGANTAFVGEPVDIARCITEAVATLPAAVQPRVRADLAADLPPVNGEANRLRDTFARLLDNAVKFSPPESPIEVHARFCGEVVVEVVDRGVGVSRLDLDKIFEPFRQVGRDQMTEKAHGTGLGLTLAKSNVERHGGRIEVDSELGNGATFRVFLPAAVVEPALV